MKKRIVAACLVVLFFSLGLVFYACFGSRIRTMRSLKKISNYDSGYNLYEIDVFHDYDIDNVTSVEIKTDSDYVNAIIKECIPLIPVKVKSPEFGCSAFCVEADGKILMGRNYDFSSDTSALLVHCKPKSGYESVATADLNNIGANNPLGIKERISCLTSPFICLDGMNEKGVGIAVLVVDSPSVRPSSVKPDISTTVAIRAVLDRAATSEEAVGILKGYDMFSSGGLDYHFFISDASGNSLVVEYDCDDENRTMKVSKVRAVTNFFELYKDKVLPNQKNGFYGHGKERYELMEKIFDESEGKFSVDVAWNALSSASQVSKEGDATSNTQWSILYNLSDGNASLALRRDFGKLYEYGIKSQEVCVSVK